MAQPKRLFEKTKIGPMDLTNRICMAEIGTRGDGHGYLSDACIDFYVARARGGAGLIMVGGTAPHISGAYGYRSPRLDDDKFIPQMAKMARLVHEASPGVKVGVQLMHVGRQMHVHEIGAVPGLTPVAPTRMPYRFGVEPHELTTEEVEEQIGHYVEAARRLKEAGFDCVELHGAHGYFISEFISPYTNKRTDKYGGSIENRARFACEIIQGIKQRCGKDFPVLIKINGADVINPEEYPLAEEQVTIEHTKAIAPLLESAGVDEIHLSEGMHESSRSTSIHPYMIPKGTQVHYATEVKKVVTIPVGAVGGLGDPLMAEQILEEGKADLIWMCRPLIADADLPNKAKEGRLDEIRYCIRCNTCIDTWWDGWLADWVCAINPEAYRESKFPIMTTERPKKILVIGGGPAGMEAARVAALIGHAVTLWEKDDKLGGQVNLASVCPDKDEFGNLIRYFSTQLDELGVKVELRKEATTDLVVGMKPDVVIAATGSTPSVPPIPGADRSNVVGARDVVAGKAAVGDKVVVIGGGEVGLDTGLLLATNGKRVTIVARHRPGRDMARMVYFGVRGALRDLSAEVLGYASTEEITDNSVIVVDRAGKRHVIEADTVVLATGSKSDRKLFDALEGKVPEIYLAGDCLYPSNIRSAIYQGASISRATAWVGPLGGEDWWGSRT